ncbi:unnamed protein product, partial [Plutella xylostella]
NLEYASPVGGPPRVEQVVLAGGHEPLAAGREPQRQHARLVQVQLVAVRFARVQDFYVRVLHADC